MSKSQTPTRSPAYRSTDKNCGLWRRPITFADLDEDRYHSWTWPLAVEDVRGFERTQVRSWWPRAHAPRNMLVVLETLRPLSVAEEVHLCLHFGRPRDLEFVATMPANQEMYNRWENDPYALMWSKCPGLAIDLVSWCVIGAEARAQNSHRRAPQEAGERAKLAEQIYLSDVIRTFHPDLT